MIRSKPAGDSFEGLYKSADQSLTRYPEGLHDWDGFFQEDGGVKRPFSFDRYVRNFTNFRGVGGGIHFGETATSSEADKAAGEGGLLTYDDASQTIKLILPSGTYSYGPISPRVLKALYTYATAYPGINLAVTIGAIGENGIVRDRKGAPVLLDPGFVDNPVGQNLYLADIVPWSLDKPTLPNGSENLASEDFIRAQQSLADEKRIQSKKIADLIGTIQPLSSFDVGRLRGLLEDNPSGPMIVAIATSKSATEFKKAYQDIAIDQAVTRYRGSADLDQEFAAVKKQADKLKDLGYSSKDVADAIILSQNGGTSIGGLRGFLRTP